MLSFGKASKQALGDSLASCSQARTAPLVVVSTESRRRRRVLPPRCHQQWNDAPFILILPSGGFTMVVVVVVVAVGRCGARFAVEPVGEERVVVGEDGRVVVEGPPLGRRHEARLEPRAHAVVVHRAADDDDFVLPVAVVVAVPERLDRLFEALGPLGAIERRPPERAREQRRRAAGEREDALVLAASRRREIRDALGSQDGVVLEPRVQDGSQTARMQRVDAAEHQRRDAVLERLGRVLLRPRLLEPHRMRFGAMQSEAARVEDALPRHDASHRAHDGRLRIHRPHRALDGVDVVDEVALVQDDDVRELDLVDEQMRDGPVDVQFVRRPAAIGEPLDRSQLGCEGRAVDDSDHRVELTDARERRRAIIFLRGKREGLGDGQRLRDTGRFDEHAIERRVASRELRQRREQVFAQRAAHAPIRQLDEPLFALDDVGAQERRVDVDLGHVVDDDRDAQRRRLAQHVRHERRLAGAQKPRQHRHREELPLLGVGFFFDQCFGGIIIILGRRWRW
mmetsp:Transcript_8741/g.36176  ORF Transcript_8741/g.36176 Transcript_8741/m.36176 type:complete len:511 (-) Transcript_8741:1009-2541(-)